MFSTHIVSFFLFALSFSMFASATPVANAAVAKRQDATDVGTVFNDLKASTDSILPQIEALVASGDVTDDSLSPLITQLTGSFSTAQTSLSAFKGKPAFPEDKLAALVAEILEAVTITLGKLEVDLIHLPVVGPLIFKLDPIVNSILLTLDIVVPGIVADVAKLLKGVVIGVAGILGGLGWTLTLLTLAL